MYVPAHFREADRARLSSLIRDNAFGTLVSVADGKPFASHIPFIYDEEERRLLGHLARGNRHWQHLHGNSHAMAIFQGPHAYVSPTWYVDPGVPTWNYAAAHVYGHARTFEEPARLECIVEALSDIYENSNDAPWDKQYDPRMLQGIVGIELTITEVHGKFKLSQNRSTQDRISVIRNLESIGTHGARGVAALMEENED